MVFAGHCDRLTLVILYRISVVSTPFLNCLSEFLFLGIRGPEMKKARRVVHRLPSEKPLILTSFLHNRIYWVVTPQSIRSHLVNGHHVSRTVLPLPTLPFSRPCSQEVSTIVYPLSTLPGSRLVIERSLTAGVCPMLHFVFHGVFCSLLPWERLPFSSFLIPEYHVRLIKLVELLHNRGQLPD